MLSIGLCGQWKWALSINPLEAWSAWSDSNRQGFRRRILSAVCLAISSHADIHLKPTSYLIAISSIGSWMMLSIPIPFIMPNRLTGAPYLALGNYAIHAYLIYLTHVPYTIVAVHQTPFNYCFRRGHVSLNIKSGLDQSSNCDYRGSLRSTIIFTFSIIPYLILFVKHYFDYFSYTNNK